MESRDRAGRVAFWLILGLAALLRFYRLGAEGFWLDEVLSIRQAPRSFVDTFRSFWLFQGLGRQVSLLPLGVALHFGTSEFVARLPYAIFGTLDVAALYFVARRLRDEPTARLAMLLLALSPLHVWYAQEARWYTQWSLCTTLTFLALVVAWREGSRKAWWGYLAATTANLATFVLSVVVVATQAVSGLLLGIFNAQHKFATRVIAHLLAGCVLAAPVLAIALRFQDTSNRIVGGPVGTPRALTLAELPYTAYTFVVGFSMGPTLEELHNNLDVRWVLATYPEIPLLAVIVVPLVLLALKTLRNDLPVAAILLPWAFLFPALVFAVSAVTGQTYNVRYSLPALTGFTLLLACGLRAAQRHRAGLLAGGALMLVYCASLGNYYWNPRYDKEHVREAVGIIEATGHTDAPVAFVGQGGELVHHYGPDLQLHEQPVCDGDGVVAAGGASLDAEPVVWLLVSRDWDRTSAPCIEALRSTHREALHESLVGVEVWRFERPNAPAQSEQSPAAGRDAPSAATRT